MNAAEHHQQELEAEQQIIETIDAARERPITPDEAMLLAWAAGLSRLYQSQRKQQ